MPSGDLDSVPCFFLSICARGLQCISVRVIYRYTDKTLVEIFGGSNAAWYLLALRVTALH